MANVKFIKDAVFTSKAAALAHISEGMDNSIECGAFNSRAEMWETDVLRDNLPNIEEVVDGETQQFASFGPDEEGMPAIEAETSTGQLAVVTQWSEVTGSEIKREEGAPYARPVAIYLLSMPTVDEIIGEDKLKPMLSELLSRQTLAAARKLAKSHAKDPALAPLPKDRIAALIAASQSRGNKSANAAFKALFPVIQGAILKTVGAKVEQLRNAKDFNNARLLNATFAKARLNAQTLEECLSSAEAAEFHFPTMPQAQWENLLKFAIQWAPKHKASKITKDDAGNTIKDAEGKAVRVAVDAPQSPVLFQGWLETRNEATVTQAEVPTVDLSDLMAA